MLKEEKIEIQSQKIEEIAKSSALWIAKKYHKTVIVEDAGFFVKALKGFPGPYSSYVYEKIGSDGILKLLEGLSNRTAEFRSAIAYCRPNRYARSFISKVKGTVTYEKRGTGGFGFDPIFVPNRTDKTFAEMTTEEKNLYSHRAKALEKFAKWYCKKTGF